MEPSIDLNAKLQERFLQLPKTVQQAITSADIEKHLRELANTHKLHVDQWATLENEVMLALLGFQKVEDLSQNLERQIGLSHDDAAALAADISKIVFEPVRGELEQELKQNQTQPKAGAAGETAVPSTAAAPVPTESAAQNPVAAPQAAATPAAQPTPPVARAAISETYKPGISSSARKDIHSDPYRESPV